MELWLLGAGAIVLIGITLWIVWPARTADVVGNPIRGEEVLKKPMDENARPTLPPQGDRFEDQYTSATADLSAGGVAAAMESMEEDAAVEKSVEQSQGAPSWATQSRPAVTPSALDQPWPVSSGMAQPRSMGLGAAVLLSVCGAVGGAWLYARWQRERNKPINRLRRGAREVGSRLGERIPDVDELPQAAAPMSGAAAALLLTAVIASRMLRRDSHDRAEQVRDLAADVLDEAMDRGREAAKRGRKAAEQGGREAERGRDALEHSGREFAERGRKAAERGGREAERGREALEHSGRGFAERGRKAAERGGREAADRGREAADRGREAAERGRKAVKRGRKEARRVSADLGASHDGPRQAGFLGLGFGGVALVAAGSYLVWRLARGGPTERQPWYAGS